MEDITQGKESLYQIIRANGSDTVYMSFGAMLKDFTRDDLIELYRLVMQKYGTNRPEDAYDRVLWMISGYVFDPPLNEDFHLRAYHNSKKKIYQKYPLSKDAYQVMLKMKLLDGKLNEVCYKLLKMIEKQAGVRKRNSSNDDKISEDLLKEGNKINTDDLLKKIKIKLLIYKVEKALYGLHQAHRAWYKTLSNYLLENGFRRGIIDKTSFIKKIKNDILLVQVYVDDIIFGSTKESLSTEFEQLMRKRFQMSSMGELTFFLGLHVEQRKDVIFLSPDKYVYDILKKFGFSSVKTTSTPMETHRSLSTNAAEADVDVHLYRSMISIQPKASHMQAMKRIFRYLKGQPTLGLWYPKDSPLDLISFSDSDYAGANIDRKSTTGGCQFLGSLAPKSIT
ncbi:putative ribonuclease H-like domain-containing protein [Tanacetum coccineum]|uniref:Ribonuclease H-like domain-containing protein n=1 Tax=Tanacetum coccineum TaxID=301880 RepID=A0ABQ5GNZ1_9ASTR